VFASIEARTVISLELALQTLVFNCLLDIWSFHTKEFDRFSHHQISFNICPHLSARFPPLCNYCIRRVEAPFLSKLLRNWFTLQALMALKLESSLTTILTQNLLLKLEEPLANSL
jgi:hypothetical protein